MLTKFYKEPTARELRLAIRLSGNLPFKCKPPFIAKITTGPTVITNCVFLSQQNNRLSFSFWAHGFICGWPRPVSSRSAKQPGWRSPPIVNIVTIVTIVTVIRSSTNFLETERERRGKFLWRNYKHKLTTAPLGSTTSFMRSKWCCMAPTILSSVTVTTPDTGSRTQGQVKSPKQPWSSHPSICTTPSKHNVRCCGVTVIFLQSDLVASFGIYHLY
jgi:hypothetical protein